MVSPGVIAAASNSVTMNQEIRNKLRHVVTQCRKLLEDSISQDLEGKYGIFARKDQVTADPNAKMTHLTDEEQAARKDILDHFGHIEARGFKPKEALDQLMREIAFTHLNRLCAYKMMEAREVYVGDQKFREAVSRGFNSNGVKFYLADHPEEERLFNTGHQDIAYRRFLDWLGGFLSDEIGILFNPNDPANRLYPRQKTLDEVLDLLNGGGIKPEEIELREEWPKIWSQDETIGWVYQYFTPKELRDQARKESAAPRNSYELAFRNQFFTPRYVVEFLADNTLGRIWYEMRRGDTKLKEQCRYMARRPTEVFLDEGEQPPKDSGEVRDDLSQEELLKLPVHILHRPKKDPRELRILDPASGSGHFLLYCFDLLLTIYEEAYADPELGPALQKDYPKLEAFRMDVPRLILSHNVHGIDIDLRASQIAALALWLRCQRTYQQMGLKRDRPKITRSNFVCAEPMPGEEQMLKEFVGQLEPKLLGQIVEVVFEKMKLVGEAGSLLKIEEEIREAVAAAKKQWVRETTQATDRKGQPLLFTQAAMDRLAGKVEQPSLFDLSDITDAQFFELAEARVIEALRQYSQMTQNGQRLQRQLFTDDAVRGFAFVDLCSKLYDVVLMNPPFGLFTDASLSYAKVAYPAASNDLYAAFVQRALTLSASGGGCAGVISSRLGFFLEGLEEWRRPLLGEQASLDVIADLGYGVLDALVETAAYTIRKAPFPRSVTAVTALSSPDKLTTLQQQLQALRSGEEATSTYSMPHALIRTFPSSVVAYWLPPHFANRIRQLPTLESVGIEVYSGLQTDDDFRFLRLWWETPLNDSSRWFPFAKGGEYQPFADDLHLAVDWGNDGAEMKTFVASKYHQWSRHIKNTDRYFRAGLTFTERTTSDLSVRALPQGAIFSVSGPVIQSDCTDNLLVAWGLLASRVGRAIIEIAIGSGDTSQSGTAARHYRTGIISAVPFPSLTQSETQRLKDSVLGLYKANLCNQIVSETHRLYCRYVGGASGIRNLAKQRVDNFLVRFASATRHSEELESIVDGALGLSTPESIEIAGPHPARQAIVNTTPEMNGRIVSLIGLSESDLCSTALAETAYSRNATKKTYYFDRRLELVSLITGVRAYELADALRQLSGLASQFEPEVAINELSFTVGCIFGRWDIRCRTSVNDITALAPFANLPRCSPSALQDSAGFLARQTPTGYPISINWEGIIVDDNENAEDIVRRVREVLEVVWESRADGVEKEACEILGVPALRDYFRKPGNGGFWDDHVSRYSKSRRKAPIYWLLQSSKRNYALWLCYHQLDKDLLFKALVNYVEPKIRLETSRLETLRGQRTAAGETGKEGKRLAKEVERQEDFISEVKDFEDKLRRAANLNLEPDLNDGVVLNIAPLHELVPWNEAEGYWEELVAGKYAWSSIGKQLRQKGLVK
jgi:hypothetical protein